VQELEDIFWREKKKHVKISRQELCNAERNIFRRYEACVDAGHWFCESSVMLGQLDYRGNTYSKFPADEGFVCNLLLLVVYLGVLDFLL
jgi:hypothetical protein